MVTPKREAKRAANGAAPEKRKKKKGKTPRASKRRLGELGFRGSETSDLGGFGEAYLIPNSSKTMRCEKLPSSRMCALCVFWTVITLSGDSKGNQKENHHLGGGGGPLLAHPRRPDLKARGGSWPAFNLTPLLVNETRY